MKMISSVLILSLFLPCQIASAITPRIAAGTFDYLVLKNDGSVWVLGSNTSSALGNGNTDDSATPVHVSGLTGVTAIAAGGDHSMALKDDGTVWAWGNNYYHQLGDGSNTNRTTPVPVSNLSGVVCIAPGLALKGDGTVWAWGYNGYGSIGDGTSIDRPTPVLVPNLTGIKAIASYGYHRMALKDDGTVWTWGGSLGGATPLQEANLSDVIAIAAGGPHNLVLKKDGTVWAWGINQYGNWYGQLGDGTSYNNRPTPGQVLNLTGVKAIAAGGDHSMALKDDGTVWAWGYNYVGQLGDGSTTNRTIPVQVSNLSGMMAIAAGGDHSIALKDDGSVWVWGLQRVLGFMQFEVQNPPQMISPNFSLLSNKFSLKDIIGILQITAGISATGNLDLSNVKDINNDGGIGLEKAIYILQGIAGKR